VKDVLGLVPGVSLAQWIGARLAATSLTIAARLFTGRRIPARPSKTHRVYETPDLEQGSATTTDIRYANGVRSNNALGL
jgi:hypothetical protein